MAGVDDLRYMMAGSMKGQAAQTPQHLQRVAQQLMATQKARSSASKYDFVKVCMAPLVMLVLTVSTGLHTTTPNFAHWLFTTLCASR